MVLRMVKSQGEGIWGRVITRVNTAVGNQRTVYGKSGGVVIGSPIHLIKEVRGFSYSPLGQLCWDSKLGEDQMA